jgi:phosphoglucosamine mutase
MVMAQSIGDLMLFGTDGIRGKVSLDTVSELDSIELINADRILTPTLMRMLGQALAIWQGRSGRVVIGWDHRPGNEALVESLTQGLSMSGMTAIHGGVCATPALHHALLSHRGNIGCMITASHNPVCDSGIKIFDNEGYKTTPQIEAMLSDLVDQIAAEDQDVDEDDLKKYSLPDSAFSADSLHKENIRHRAGSYAPMAGKHLSDSLLLDCSKGAPHAWLAGLLGEFGIGCQEVSNRAETMNLNCGAGELSPTDKWTFEEAALSPHLLISSLKKQPPGLVVGAALDGDGDRCLMIRSTDTGFEVIDGDEMADIILRTAAGSFQLAASIESDLSLLTSLTRLDAEVLAIQTAVGDRWLADALRSVLIQGKGILESEQTPDCLGVEDSGHIVLPKEHPLTEDKWVLVGDGSATLIAVLSAMAKQPSTAAMQRGFKQRISIKGSDRSRWDGENELATKVVSIITETLDNPEIKKIAGEKNLLLVLGDDYSIGVRNSGTEAKTNISLRLAAGIDEEPYLLVVEKIENLLRNNLIP